MPSDHPFQKVTPREKFKAIMHGNRSAEVLFWEVWFQKFKMLEKRYGDPAKIESKIKMAQELGMAAVSIGYLDLNCLFGQHQSTMDGESRYSGGSLRHREQLDEKPLPDWSAIIPELQQRQQLVAAAGIASVLYLPWCFHAIATSMGLEHFAMTLYDDFDFLKTGMHWVEERNRKAIDQVVQLVRPDLVLFDGDCAFKTGLMVRPAQLRELVFEETRATVAKLQALDIPYALHSDGKLDELIPLLIELGFSAIHGCEKQANDLSDLVERFGDDICLVGNMDVVFLTRANLDQVRTETQNMLKIGSQKDRYIAASNTSPQDYIPDENYLAMCEAIRDFNNLNLIQKDQLGHAE
jgi:uroporphyrinogen decarboxylase